MDKEEFPKVLLRVCLSIVFLYFGVQQVLDASAWTGFVPEFATKFFLSANNIVVMNGVLELILGTFMIIGLYTRASALILSIHLFFIAISMGFVPTSVRDFGLSIATFIIFLNGPDKYCFDRKHSPLLS